MHLFVIPSAIVLVAVLVERKLNIKFPDYVLLQLAFVAQLAARGSHNPKVAGSIPVESITKSPIV